MSTPNLSIDIQDSPYVTETTRGFAIEEGTSKQRRKVYVEVKLDQASTEVVTVDYFTKDGTVDGEANSTLPFEPDFRKRTGTFTFQPGETKKKFALDITSGRKPEADETFTINLGNAVNANLPVDPTVITILDDDGPRKPVLSINIKESDVVSKTDDGFAIVEGTFRGRRKVYVEIRLDAPSTETVTVDYRTIDGTAGSDVANLADYRKRSGSVTFEPGETKKKFKVDITAGTMAEDDETFSIALENATNARLPFKDTVITILDDDSVPASEYTEHTVNTAALSLVDTANSNFAGAGEQQSTIIETTSTEVVGDIVAVA